MDSHYLNIAGLSSDQVKDSRKRHGSNIIEIKKSNPVLDLLIDLMREPMVLLLLIAASIYLISGEIADAVFLAVAILLVAAISLFQDSRSRNALDKLKKYTQPLSKVIRNGETVEINSDDIVLGDYIMVEEGGIIPADGLIIHSNDFSVDESILTGESFSVFKSKEEANNEIYSGTRVNSGLAIAEVKTIGNKTQLGKIGKSLENIEEQKTPLQIQINNFVKKMVILGAIVFLIVWIMNYLNTYDLLDSLLKALTLAMSILPEEIPVAFTTFMAMGAWRLMNNGIVVKQMHTVETLGSATVICVDKTGTITENKMEIVGLYTPDNSNETPQIKSPVKKELIRIAMWASEPIPFDPMEVAIHTFYENSCKYDERPEFHMYHEYPLGGKPPMMTHILENNEGVRIIAAKGAPEAILQACSLEHDEKEKYQRVLEQLTAKGYRLLGIAKGTNPGNNFPKRQQDIEFSFVGFIAFYDPPKANIKDVLKAFAEAGVKVKIITGDNKSTTLAIAEQIEFPEREKILDGKEFLEIPEDQLASRINATSIFTRMYPEAKLKIINTLKSQNEIVAMTGDGVNDAPALKSAHIGVAMGKRGTEIAKNTASLILLEDDLSKMVEAISMGRKIYANLKKAIRYIISIHIPIILVVFIPLILGWIYPNIFSPVHVILLELIMGPTCSIIYESEPVEKNIMQQSPRIYTESFFNNSELIQSVIQGVVIGIGVLTLYQFALHNYTDEKIVRTMVFTALMSANIFLTLVNRSFYYSIFTTLKYKNNLIPFILLISLGLSLSLIYIEPLSHFFKFDILDLTQLSISYLVGFVSVIWYELIKWNSRRNSYNDVGLLKLT